MGPGDGIQIQRLMDLPTTLETAEGSPGSSQSTLSQASSQQGVQRVKSLLQTSAVGGASGSKLPSRLPGGHMQPPQRSISHNEVIKLIFFWGD